MLLLFTDMAYQQPAGVHREHFKDCSVFGFEHQCSRNNYQKCMGCAAAVCPNVLQSFSAVNEEPLPHEVFCPHCVERMSSKLLRKVQTFQAGQTPLMPAASSAAEPTNSSNIVSQTEPGSPNANTGGELAPPSPDRRNTVSFGSDNSSVAESDGTTDML